MGDLVITAINRNPGATSQSYRIEYKHPDDLVYMAGPTLTYNQAQPAPLGVLPVHIPLDMNTWPDVIPHANVRIVTICGAGVEVFGDVVNIPVTNDPCLE